MANTVLLKAREGTACPRPVPLRVPVSRPGPRSHAAPRPPPLPAPAGTLGPGHPTPPAPPPVGTPGPRRPGRWVTGRAHPGWHRCSPGRGRPSRRCTPRRGVRPSVPPTLRTPGRGARNLKSSLSVGLVSPSDACAEAPRAQGVGRSRAPLSVCPSVLPCQRDVAGVDGARASKTLLVPGRLGAGLSETGAARKNMALLVRRRSRGVPVVPPLPPLRFEPHRLLG